MSAPAKTDEPGPVTLTAAEATQVLDALNLAAQTHPQLRAVVKLGDAANMIVAVRASQKVAPDLAEAYARFAALVAEQAAWSHRTFGPGTRTLGLLDHLRKELVEVGKAPYDLSEWIDLAILAIDGAWRHASQTDSGEPMLFSEDEVGTSDYAAVGQLVVDAYCAKLAKNFERTWPDWRTAPADKAIEHDRTGEPE